MLTVSLLDWTVFNVIVLGLLAIDLFLSRKVVEVPVKRAFLMTLIWIGLALLFNGWIYYVHGKEPAVAFFVSYLLEKSLSMDNLFVFVLIFTYFKVPEKAKYPLLFFGILGAILMRGGLIWGGILLLQSFHAVTYIFGAFLIYTGIKLFWPQEEMNFKENIIFKTCVRLLPVIQEYHGSKFFIKQAGRWVGTLLFVVLIIVEMTDLVFALDSVTAVFGITTDPYLVYTSNICAILGLRSLFFVFQGSVKKFYLLHFALAFILIFIGIKMAFAEWLTISIGQSLSVIAIALFIAIFGSWYFPRRDNS